MQSPTLKPKVEQLQLKRFLPGPWRAMHLTWACLPMTPVCDLGLVLIFGFSHCGLRRSYCSVSVTPENFVICCQEWDQMLQVLRAFFVRLLEGPLSVNDEVQNAATPADDTFKKEALTESKLP